MAVEDVAPSDDAAPGGSTVPAPKAAAVAVPLLSTMLAITALRSRICAFSPQRNRTPRYGTSNHVSCFSAVSEFQGTFSRPRSEREGASDPSLQTLHSHALFTNKRLSLGIYASFFTLPLCYITSSWCEKACQPEFELSSKTELKFQYLVKSVTIALPNVQRLNKPPPCQNVDQFINSTFLANGGTLAVLSPSWFPVRRRPRREGRSGGGAVRARRRRTADADGAFWPFLTYRMPGMRRWFLSAMNFKHTICSILAPEQKPSKHRSTPHSLERQARRRYILVEKAFCFLWFVLYQVQLPNATQRERKR